MLKLISVICIMLFSIITFSQEIEKEVDNFTGDTIWTLKSSNLSGGSFWDLRNANLTLVYYSGKTLFMKLWVTSGKLFSVKQGVIGASLKIKTDNKTYELTDNGQNTFETGVQGSGLCKVVYIIDFALVKDIVDSKEPKVRIVTSDEVYLDFYFGEDNIKEYKKFYKKFNK